MANQYTKKRDLISTKNKREIFWHIINSLLAGMLVVLGSLSSGEFSIRGIIIGLIAALIVAVTKFRDYWSTEEHEYSSKMFNFVR